VGKVTILAPTVSPVCEKESPFQQVGIGGFAIGAEAGAPLSVRFLKEPALSLSMGAGRQARNSEVWFRGRRGWATSRNAREVAHPQFFCVSVQRQGPRYTFWADVAHPPPTLLLPEE